MKLQIAIDGPAGSGKSTAARLVARELDYIHIDTGALYRAVALLALKMGVDPNDGEALSRLAEDLEISVRTNSDGLPVYFLKKEDVTTKLRSPEINKLVPHIAKIQVVRAAVTKKLQTLASRGGVVMDGRDIGTVVLPMAEVKIFITADLSARVARRKNELLERGFSESTAAVMEEVQKRDREDIGRQLAPLKVASGAHIIDTTNLNPDQMVHAIIDLVEKKKQLIQSGGVQP